MRTAFHREVARGGVECDSAGVDHDVGVLVVSSNENGSLVTQPFAGYVDFADLGDTRCQEGHSATGGTSHLIVSTGSYTHPGLRLDATMVVNARALQANGSTGTRGCGPNAVTAIGGYCDVGLDNYFSRSLQPESAAPGSGAFLGSRPSRTASQKTIQGSIAINL